MRHAQGRFVCQRHADFQLIAEHLFQAEQLRAAAGEGDALVKNVAHQFGRGALNDPVQRADEHAQRFIQRFDHLFRVDRHRARQAGNQASAAGVHRQLRTAHAGRADVDLQFLCRARADEQVVLLAHEVDDRVVKRIAAHVKDIPHDLMAEGEHGHVGAPAADIHIHAAIRLVDAHARTDGGSHALIHRQHAAHTRVNQHIHKGLPLAGGHAAGQCQQDARPERRSLAHHLAHKVAQHLAEQIKAADTALAERLLHNQAGRRTAVHPARLLAHGNHIARLPVIGHIRRLAEHNALAAHHDVHHRRTQIQTQFIYAKHGIPPKLYQSKIIPACFASVACGRDLIRPPGTFPIGEGIILALPTPSPMGKVAALQG